MVRATAVPKTNRNEELSIILSSVGYIRRVLAGWICGLQLCGIGQKKHTACFSADLLVRAASRHADKISSRGGDACAINHASLQHVTLLCISMFMGRIDRS